LLEILVHLEVPVGDLPRNYKLLEIEVPADIAIENLETFADLRENWADDQKLTQELGDSWLDRNSAALLEVPSALAPHTANFLLNPLHPDAERIRIRSTAQYKIDERLLR
jgi:RES domain-containing protein